MITSDFVFDAISKVVERFNKDGYTQRTYSEVVFEDEEMEEIHFFIEDEIRTLLDGLGLKNVVECVDVYWELEFETEIYNVYVCFVLDGELYNCNFIAERRF